MKKILVGIFIFLISVSISSADWREELGKLRIGILAGDDVSRSVAAIEPFRKAIEESLGIDVEIYGARDYANLVQAHTSGRVEYAILSATAFSISRKICKCNEALVVAKSGDGTSHFNSVIIARDGGISSPSQLAGRQVIALSRDSVAGYAFPIHELALQDVNFKELNVDVIFGTSARESVMLFAQGQGEALIGWSSLDGDQVSGYSRGTLKELSKFSNGDANQYNVIWQSKPIPHRVHSIVNKIPSEAKAALQEQLQSMFDSNPVAYDAAEPIFGGGFVAAQTSSFDPLIEFVGNPTLGQ